MNTPEDLDNVVKGRRDILLAMFQESRTHMRHYESQMATITNIILVVTVSIITITASGGLTCRDWPLTTSLIIIGLYGTLFTNIYFRRISHYKERAGEFYNELDVLLFGRREAINTSEARTLKGILDTAKRGQIDKFLNLRGLRKIELFLMFWPITIAIIGTAATVYMFLSLC